ncbi:MAG: (2Fe-2S)-binding protein [Bacteroidales bacterium]|nr:(2Fe-2S)-binding protein [Bacteroidales bacterium]
MPKIRIDGIDFQANEGWTILETANYLGLEIPTLCYHNGLSPWGGCRLCIVEIMQHKKPKLVTSCTYPVEEGLVVRTNTEKVENVRKIILELLISQCPTSKVLQDLASKIGLNRVRFSPKWENCIYCGLCVRMCNEQMMAEAIGFSNRGKEIKIDTPFQENSEVCRKCGGCIYVCPACTLRCDRSRPETILCGGCSHYQPLS